MKTPAKYHYAYNDYAEWDDDMRYEVIDGVPYIMPAQSINHQAVLGEILLQFGKFLKGKPITALHAPLDVRLNAHGKDDTVVQPDFIVVRDRLKLADGKSCKGAPDLIVEILSLSSYRKDFFIKKKKYLEAGVREYWIVNPENQTVQAFVLENGKYFAQIYGPEDTAPVHVLDGCEINLAEVFV